MMQRYCPRCGARVPTTAEQCPSCGGRTPRRSAALDATDPASVGGRVLAAVVDAVPVLLLAAGLVVALASGGAGWMWLTLLGLAVAWCLLLWWWASATGQGPGKSLLHLRVVDERTGGRVDAWRSLLRLAARSVMTLGTLGAAAFSYRWDPAGREQTWWDRAAGTRVIAESAAAGTVAWFDPDAAWGPVLPPPGQLPPVASSVSMPPPRLPQHPPHAHYQQPTAAGSWPTVPTAPAAPAAPSAPSAPIVPAAAGQSVSSGIDDPTRIVRRTQISAALPADDQPPANNDVTTIVDVAALGIEPLDDTIAKPTERAVVPSGATLEWDSGVRVVADGVVLIGRDPIPEADEQVDRRLAVGSESIGVSKTHLTLTISADGITVTDRHSTNGVSIVRADDNTEKCEPGHATAVQQGDRIRFGGRSVLIVADASDRPCA
ncbi:MAG: RDD family protein [Nakamurella sp.]